MNLTRLKLIYHTVKYLRFKQVYYRLYYAIRNRFFKREYYKKLDKVPLPITWVNKVYYSSSFLLNNKFNFLNIEHQFKNQINWNLDDYGKLWTYNLNYFDFLNQRSITTKTGIALIRDFISEDKTLKDGKEPYPISLRTINWIKFLAKNKIEDQNINQSLYNHYQILLHNLEYHLLGNHLLENAFSLFFGGIYFKDDELINKSLKLLKVELNEQILNDGGHFELSPMYHQILLHRLLDCIYLDQQNSRIVNSEIILLLKEKAVKMLSWLQTITFNNGDIPMVNDSAYGIALNSNQLYDYANELGIEWNIAKLSDSGYRKFSNNNFEVLIDVGKLAIAYQPGHAHADTFNFILYAKNKPVIVDPAVSTYEINTTRERERSTLYHNTVTIDDENTSQVWSGFRVAKRAKVDIQLDKVSEVVATINSVDNYKHTRTYKINNNIFYIEDQLSANTKAKASFHFHPNCRVSLDADKNISAGSVIINFSNAIDIKVLDYQFAKGFNSVVIAKKVVVLFIENLRTEIKVAS